jgi:hypothetical protein
MSHRCQTTEKELIHEWLRRNGGWPDNQHANLELAGWPDNQHAILELARELTLTNQ